MSREKEAVELLRAWADVWKGLVEVHADDGPLLSRTKSFLAKHDIKKCHCGGKATLWPVSRPWKDELTRYAVRCDTCGHAGKSSHTEHGAERNWKFTQEAIREKRYNDSTKRGKEAEERRRAVELSATDWMREPKCSECGK